ncbi:MAG: tyrosine--tRNA ligase [Patescibacteria group bacterium]
MDKIDEVLTRGVANVIPGKDELAKALRSGKKLNIYLGIDPTAPRIHLGHAVPLRKLQLLAGLGHNVTLLIGNFTTLIGDTSDKESERPILTEEEIEQNFQTYKEQASKILDFSKIKVVHNGDWLSKLTFKDIIKLTQHFSVNDFITRELIAKRLKAGKHIRLDEVLYPIMQGYDSYHLDTDVQLGGTDQTFNLQAGRTLQRVLRNKESFVMTNPFLDGTDGRKMSKSWGNAIWLSDTPEDMYAKVLAIKDELIVQYFTLGTNLPLEEIDTIEEALKSGEHPMQLKKRLAFAIVSELYDKKEAEKAAEAFLHRVQKKELPADIPSIRLTEEPNTLSDALVHSGLVESKSEAKRVITQGGTVVDNQQVTDPYAPFEAFVSDSGTVIQVGKRRIVKIEIEK